MIIIDILLKNWTQSQIILSIKYFIYKLEITQGLNIQHEMNSSNRNSVASFRLLFFVHFINMAAHPGDLWIYTELSSCFCLKPDGKDTKNNS